MTLPQNRSFVPETPPGAKDLPYDDGEPMDSEKHFRQMTALIQSLETAWEDRQDFYIGGNMAVYYSQLQTRQNDFRGPDVFVVLDTVRKERLSWVVWEEGGRMPDVVIELLSPTTEAADRGVKMDIYARILRVGEYYLFDPHAGRLEGYQLDRSTRHYRPIEPDQAGRLPCHQLGLHLGVFQQGKIGACAGPWLRWLDDRGQVLPLPTELASQEAQRADALAEKLAAYEKKFGALGE